ncbi:hypothetical protein ACFLSW_00720 [Candidatus Bipolaricaulota bacterium]
MQHDTTKQIEKHKSLETLIELQKLAAILPSHSDTGGPLDPLRISTIDLDRISNRLQWFFEELPSVALGGELTSAVHDGITRYRLRTGKSWYRSKHAIAFLTKEGLRARKFLEALAHGRVYIDDLSNLNAALRCYSTEWAVSGIDWASRVSVGTTRIPLGPAVPPTVYAVAPQSERLFYGKGLSSRLAENTFIFAALSDRFADLRWFSEDDYEGIISGLSSTAWGFAFPNDPWRQRFVPYPPVNPVRTLQAALKSEEAERGQWSYRTAAATLSEHLPSYVLAITPSELRRLAAGEIAPFGRLDEIPTTQPRGPRRGVPESVWPGRVGALIDAIADVIGGVDAGAPDRHDLLLRYFIDGAGFGFRFLTIGPNVLVGPIYTRLMNQLNKGETPPLGDYGFSEIYALCFVLLQSIGQLIEDPPQLMTCSNCRTVFVRRRRRPPSKNTFCSDSCRTDYHNQRKKRI